MIALCGIACKLWKRLAILEDEIVEMKDSQRVDGMMIGVWP